MVSSSHSTQQRSSEAQPEVPPTLGLGSEHRDRFPDKPNQPQLTEDPKVASLPTSGLWGYVETTRNPVRKQRSTPNTAHSQSQPLPSPRSASGPVSQSRSLQSYDQNRTWHGFSTSTARGSVPRRHRSFDPSVSNSLQAFSREPEKDPSLLAGSHAKRSHVPPTPRPANHSPHESRIQDPATILQLERREKTSQTTAENEPPSEQSRIANLQRLVNELSLTVSRQGDEIARQRRALNIKAKETAELKAANETGPLMTADLLQTSRELLYLKAQLKEQNDLSNRLRAELQSSKDISIKLEAETYELLQRERDGRKERAQILRDLKAMGDLEKAAAEKAQFEEKKLKNMEEEYRDLENALEAEMKRQRTSERMHSRLEGEFRRELGLLGMDIPGLRGGSLTKLREGMVTKLWQLRMLEAEKTLLDSERAAAQEREQSLTQRNQHLQMRNQEFTTNNRELMTRNEELTRMNQDLTADVSRLESTNEELRLTKNQATNRAQVLERSQARLERDVQMRDRMVLHLEGRIAEIVVEGRA